MLYEKELIAHKLNQWEAFIEDYHLPPWQTIPDIGLYMEQVVILLGQYLSFMPDPDERRDRQLTSSTINNYVRLKLMPPPVKKKYYRVHIAYLILILTLKQSLSIQEIQRAIPTDLDAVQMQALYCDYAERFRAVSLFFAAQARAAAQEALQGESSGDAAGSSLVIKGALVSGFARILAEKILHLQGVSLAQALNEKAEPAQEKR